MQIKVDDIVEVRVGDDRGERGRVLNVDRRTGKVLVEGMNRVYKHVRRSQRNPQGGRLSKEMPVQASNVLMVCTKCGKPTRLGVRYEATGSKGDIAGSVVLVWVKSRRNVRLTPSRSSRRKGRFSSTRCCSS